MTDQKLNIICFPGTLYDSRPWTNRQHVMTRFAAAGHQVLYVEPPRWVIGQAAKITLGLRREQCTRRWFRRLIEVEQRDTNLSILSLVRYVPTRSRFWRRLNYWLNLPALRANARRHHFHQAVLWVYTPDAVACVGQLGERLVCYDCVDQYAEQPYYAVHLHGTRDDEAKLLSLADIVITSAHSLYADKSRVNPNTYLVQNVGDFDHFSQALSPDVPIPPAVNALPRPRIGFLGALDAYKLDVEMLTHLALERPEWSLVLLGPRGAAERPADLSRLLDQPNVHWLGPKPYAELPGFVKGFDVCVIPYATNAYTRGCFPLKFFECLASGRPVIVSGLPELAQYEHLVGVADSADAFVFLIDEALQCDTEAKLSARLAVAKANTWDSKVERLLNIVQDTLTERERMAAK